MQLVEHRSFVRADFGCALDLVELLGEHGEIAAGLEAAQIRRARPLDTGTESIARTNQNTATHSSR